jgi:hypothetical protein
MIFISLNVSLVSVEVTTMFLHDLFITCIIKNYFLILNLDYIPGINPFDSSGLNIYTLLLSLSHVLFRSLTLTLKKKSSNIFFCDLREVYQQERMSTFKG